MQRWKLWRHNAYVGAGQVGVWYNLYLSHWVHHCSFSRLNNISGHKTVWPGVTCPASNHIINLPQPTLRNNSWNFLLTSGGLGLRWHWKLFAKLFATPSQGSQDCGSLVNQYNLIKCGLGLSLFQHPLTLALCETLIHACTRVDRLSISFKPPQCQKFNLTDDFLMRSTSQCIRL